jgi:hypothetical protein
VNGGAGDRESAGDAARMACQRHDGIVHFVDADTCHTTEVDRADAFVTGGAFHMFVDDRPLFIRRSFNIAGGAEQRHQRRLQRSGQVHRAAIVRQQHRAAVDQGDELTNRRLPGEVDNAAAIELFAYRLHQRGAARIPEVDDIGIRVLQEPFADGDEAVGQPTFC